MRDQLGPTGDYPHGRLNADDKGGVRMGVAHDDEGNVHINFGTEVKWVAMPPDTAIDFAKTILRHAGAKKVEIEL